MSEDRRLFLASRGLLDAYLTARGMRRTPERYAVLTSIGSMGRRVFTTSELEAMIGSEELRVSRATLYNALATFVDAGLIEPCGGDGSRRSFRLSPGGERAEARCQLVCTSCGKVKDVRDVSLVRMIMQVRYPGFTPEAGLMTISGLCGDCRRRVAREKARASKLRAAEERNEPSQAKGRVSTRAAYADKKITKGKTTKK